MPTREKGSWANQLVTVLEALKLLSRPQGASYDELEEGLSVSRRQVYRIKDLVGNMGIAVHEVEGNLLETKKRFSIEGSQLLRLPNLSPLTFPEVLALYAVRGNLGIYQGTSIAEGLDSAFVKLGMILPPGMRKALERYASLFIPNSKRAKNFAGQEEIIDDLHYAMLNNLTCTATYHSFSDHNVKKFNVNPLHFFERDGGLYLLVAVTHYGDLRILAVERIKEIDITDEIFSYPDGLNPQEFLEMAFNITYDDPLEVKIWFSIDQAPYIVERQWAKEQSIKKQLDGSIILEMKTSGWDEVKRWVMGFGREAEVITPVEMREEIVAEFGACLHRYRCRQDV